MAAFILFPLALILLVILAWPSLLITRAEFLLRENTTWLTYFWFWRRRIALPAALEISSHPSKSSCYVGQACLTFARHRHGIPILYTTGWFDDDEAAEKRAAEAATEIGRVLRLPIHLPRHDGFQTGKDRLSCLFGGLFCGAFSAVMLYAGLGPGELHGDSIPFLPEKLDQAIGRSLFLVVGTLCGVGALYLSWLVVKPNPPGRRK